jgi:hypothetical protein
LWWLNLYPIAVFDDFSSKLLLDITNVSMEFDLLIDFENHRTGWRIFTTPFLPQRGSFYEIVGQNFW